MKLRRVFPRSKRGCRPRAPEVSAGRVQPSAIGDSSSAANKGVPVFGLTEQGLMSLPHITPLCSHGMDSRGIKTRPALFD